jgi:hypothetical protein
MKREQVSVPLSPELREFVERSAEREDGRRSNSSPPRRGGAEIARAGTGGMTEDTDNKAAIAAPCVEKKPRAGPQEGGLNRPRAGRPKPGLPNS